MTHRNQARMCICTCQLCQLPNSIPLHTHDQPPLQHTYPRDRVGEGGGGHLSNEDMLITSGCLATNTHEGMYVRYIRRQHQKKMRNCPSASTGSSYIHGGSTEQLRLGGDVNVSQEELN